MCMPITPLLCWCNWGNATSERIEGPEVARKLSRMSGGRGNAQFEAELQQSGGEYDIPYPNHILLPVQQNGVLQKTNK